MQAEGMDYSTRRRAGIYYVWDPTKISVAGIEEVYASRVARVSIQVLDLGKELEVYGVYMPVRDNKAERTEEIWNALMQDITERGVIEDLNLIASVTEDFTFERVQTQIDNILVPIELIHNLKEAHTSTGVREKDHKIVMATLAWELKGGKGGRRPTRRHTDKFQEAQWLRYERILQERTNEIQEKLGDKKPSVKLRIIQDQLNKTAEEVAGEDIESSGAEGRE
eukprot:3109758-Pleurochrysis_carterae.AAC.1